MLRNCQKTGVFIERRGFKRKVAKCWEGDRRWQKSRGFTRRAIIKRRWPKSRDFNRKVKCFESRDFDRKVKRKYRGGCKRSETELERVYVRSLCRWAVAPTLAWFFSGLAALGADASCWKKLSSREFTFQLVVATSGKGKSKGKCKEFAFSCGLNSSTPRFFSKSLERFDDEDEAAWLQRKG